MIVEAAQRNPRRFGLSHHAEGRVVQRQGKSVVESIESVKSVDLVQSPATNQGLFESQAAGPAIDATESTDAKLQPVLADLLERIERIELLAHCRTLLEAAHRTCDPVRLQALLALSEDEERTRLIESWPESGAERALPRRPVASRPLFEAQPETMRFPDDVKSFVAALR